MNQYFGGQFRNRIRDRQVADDRLRHIREIFNLELEQSCVIKQPRQKDQIYFVFFGHVIDAFPGLCGWRDCQRALYGSNQYILPQTQLWLCRTKSLNIRSTAVLRVPQLTERV